VESSTLDTGSFRDRPANPDYRPQASEVDVQNVLGSPDECARVIDDAARGSATARR
jgi:hypothetical protein